MITDRQATWSFSTAGRVTFGWGAAQHLGRLTSQLGGAVLVCSDAVLDELGVASAAADNLRAAGLEVTVFSGGQAEVSTGVVDDCLSVALSTQADVIVGLGGGSNMDLAKAVALLASHPGDLSSYYGENRVPAPVQPVVAVPTTAGTGSEVSPVCVISDPQRVLKVGVSSRYLIPRLALVDPSLTVSCPPTVTAHSGLDALGHAVESFMAVDYEAHGGDDERVFVGKNPVSDSLATSAVKLIGGSLRTAYSDGSNKSARTDMSLASLLAGMAFSSAGTAVAHALQYPIGARTGTPHGLGIALLLPAVMKFNEQTRARESGVLVDLLSNEEQQARGMSAADCVLELADSVGMPSGLGEIGVSEDDLPGIADQAWSVERLLANSPQRVDRDDLIAILQDAL